MSLVPTPSGSTISKTAAGLSDITYVSGVYRFLNCDVLGCTTTIGFNGTSSSCSVSIVEDPDSGGFIQPRIPSVFGISMPSGGLGQQIFPSGSLNLNPIDFFNSNVPFYFGGICTSWQNDQKDISGGKINVNIQDPKDLLSGIQLLLNGFALSQNIGDGSPRFQNGGNIIDVWGYFNYGLDANANYYGISWQDIKTVIEATSVTMNDIVMEFVFTGTCFTVPPSYYRINDNIIDLLGLVQKVASDGGCDLIIVSRKINDFSLLIEIRGIRRENTLPITQSEISGFISTRSDIVQSARQGQEYRNEPTSSVVIGGMKNSMYVAYPSQYLQDIHLTSFTNSIGVTVSGEDYNAFPQDLKVRLFGGDYTKYTEQTHASGINTSQETLSVNAGAIFPFWGFTPDDHAYPLIEPFLPLDHLVFDRATNAFSQLQNRIPICKLGVKMYPVREVTHSDVFLTGDGTSNTRPFAYVSGVITSGPTVPGGWQRGLPLNTEVLRAALVDPLLFYNVYAIHYPDIAQSLGFQIQPNNLLNFVASNGFTSGFRTELENYFPWMTISTDSSQYSLSFTSLFDSQGRTNKNAIASGTAAYQNEILNKFNSVIHELVKQYALENMGKKFIVTLPRSIIMERIWNGSGVPTNPFEPQIEYVVDEKGYFTYLPTDIDFGVGSGNGIFTNDEVNQIQRKFMSEPDGRFYAMAAMDWKPKGNCSFFSNGLNRAMFQDLPMSEFRPNRIASANPQYVLISASVRTLRKRPDLALVELPNAIMFDPFDTTDVMHNYQYDPNYDLFMSTKSAIVKYLWYFYKRDYVFRSAIELAKPDSLTMDQYASKVISIWADGIKNFTNNYTNRELSTEFVMDLKGLVIPLTSTWVSYGPWYYDYANAKGIRKIEVDDSLVPWNFNRPTSGTWDANLNTAGNERVARNISVVDYLDNASITVAGFPEFGLGTPLGYNSNITAISVDFGLGGIRTTYTFATYLAKPGTYRKSEYDNISRARVDIREKLPDTINDNLLYPDILNPASYGPNMFKF